MNHDASLSPFGERRSWLLSSPSITTDSKLVFDHLPSL